ncbi:drug resistance transporter, EmrB/QacA subfamily [Sporobacter termitidis DSM 10068]|uniref:Drug resistance transporter, EmrB/QacA subfamily n=1 Tax=Sporobacter termitidis DSM 10068 TaxID=1123282 RepID=A0A1M5XCM8_9FIRM|nr:MFS transporter [Sporobacter termitidis]SHH97328.1 drug resistance transporter, EmrB/QacA subfamily [Sporobacter termitidis DSM 10068]
MDQTKLKRVALIVAMCHFMDMMDATIITTAIPTIAVYFHSSTALASITITAYIITLAVFIPISGWMSVRFNVKRIFLLAVLIFTAASLGCALSPSLPLLIATRILQGIGGAMMFPVGRLIVLQKAPKSDLLMIISFLVWPALIAPAIAPLIGGLIVTYASWHWIFLINVPIGIVAFFLSRRFFDDTAGDRTARLDWKGFALIGVGAGGLVLASEILADSAASWTLGLVLFLLFAAELVLTYRYLKRAQNPLINLKVLKYRTFRISQVGGSLFWFSVGSAPYLLTLLFQNEFGWSPAYAGSIVLFIFVGNVAIKPASTWLLNRFGFKPVFIGSFLAVIATMLVSGWFTAQTPVLLLIVVITLSGMGRSLALTSYNTLSFSELDAQETRDANSLASTTQNMAQAIGIAVTVVVLRFGSELFGAASSQAWAYRLAFILLAVFATLALAEILTLPRKTGSAILKHRDPAGKSPR